MANFHLGTGSTFDEQVANGSMTQQSHVYNHDINWVFSPRVGLAWDPTGSAKWVVRGGIGLYHDFVTLGNSENGLKGNPPGWVVPTFYNNGSTAAPIFSYGTQNKYPFGFQYPAFQGTPLNAQGGVTGSQISVGGIDENIHPPRTLNWSATLEHQLTDNIVMSIGYVGSHSGDLVTDGGNTGATSYGVDINRYSGDLIQHPNCQPEAGSSQYVCTGILTRLNPSFGAITYAQNGARANYSALIVAAKGRFARNGFFTASYTRSVAKDNWQSYPLATSLDQFYGPSSWDVPNRVSLGWGYELPGLHNGQGFLGHILSGWVLSGTTILQSGEPFTVYTGAPFLATASDANGTNLQMAPGSGDYNGDGYNYDFPSVSSYNVSNSRQAYINGLFASGTFTQPQIGQGGNEKVGQFRNPGFAETDASLKKVSKITERVKLEVRFDFFNLFNRVNLTGVDANMQDATFGQSTSTQIPRQGQIGAKISF
jgi:hypothetical protein